MAKPLIAVSGKNGQLGWELHQLHAAFSHAYEFVFCDRETLDLNRPETIEDFFLLCKPQYFINCAAYTAVDKAEAEKETALAVNATAVGQIASACAAIGCTLITISTDYVFDGNGTRPYKADEPTNPLNYYGYTKWKGEQLALENNAKTIIIRTSWVYSVHGNNFVKTMLRLMKDREEIKVVSDQVGCPTYAADLAAAILTVVGQLESGNRQYGIYQYSNQGIISWHHFAEAIRDGAGLACRVLPIPSSSYPTPAKRPFYSAMETHKIADAFQLELMDWQKSLSKCLELLLV